MFCVSVYVCVVCVFQVNKGMRETPRLDGGSTYISHSASHQKLFSVMAKMYPHLTRYVHLPGRPSDMVCTSVRPTV